MPPSPLPTPTVRRPAPPRPVAPRRTARRFIVPATAALLVAAGGAATATALHDRPVLAARQRPDLAITHAAVLDVRTGIVRRDATVLVRDGVITAVTPGTTGVPDAARVIDAHGRLLTPGLTDVHLHTHLVFNDPAPDGGTTVRPLVMRPDSIAAYRRALGRAYLPYGVTLVRDVATDERYLPMLTAWTRRSPDAPDFVPSGAYLVSAERGREPVSFGVAVDGPEAAAAKVRQYHAAGIRNVKLYWRLREPELRAAFGEARRLGMEVTAHVDMGVVTIQQALGVGVRHFEHVHPFAVSVMPEAEMRAFYDTLPKVFGNISGETPGIFDMLIMEQWNHLGPSDARVLALIDSLAAHDASVTPTLHVFAQDLGLAYFASRPWDRKSDATKLTPAQRARAVAGYRTMASYVKRLHDAGVRLDVGTDTPDPGKAVLSEMLLLHDAGIPMPAVFRIATLQSAADIGQGRDHGAVEVGMRADLVLFEGDPLTRPRELLGGRTVIKDGVVWRP